MDDARNVSSELSELQERNALLAAVTNAHASYLREADAKSLFNGLLADLYRADQQRRTAEAERSAVHGRMAAIVTHLSDIITILRVDGSWVASSPAGTRLLGYPHGYEPPGGLFSLLHPDDVELARTALDEVVRGVRSPTEPVELRVRDADGEYRVLETVGVDRTDDPAIGGVLLTSHDVTDRWRTEQMLTARTDELVTLVGNMRDAVLFVDSNGEARFVNQAFCDIFAGGVPADRLIGTHVTNLTASTSTVVADPESFFRIVEDAYRDLEPRIEETIVLCDGRVLERDYLPIARDSGAVHLWLFRDVTDRRRLQEESQRVLEHEREMRAASEEQNAALRELDELKDEFVATVSHELRTPLTSILSFSELLETDVGQLSAEHRQFAGIVRRNATRLLELVDNLLLAGRLDAVGMRIDRAPCDLAALVDSVAGRMARVAADKDIVLTVEHLTDRFRVRVDSSRIDQVVTNLVSNAIKFTPEGGTVTVRTERRDGSWTIAVVDTGIGIPVEDRDSIFDRFHRGSNVRDRALPGTGLGLSICRAIVELHGGSITVDGTEEGSSFTVFLPDVDDMGSDRAPDEGAATEPDTAGSS